MSGFGVMAARRYSTAEVLELLENEELLNDELESKINLVDLDGESEDDDTTPQGDGIHASGSIILLPNEYLDSDCIPLLTTAIGNPPTPTEKDSLLYSDTEDEFSSEEGK